MKDIECISCKHFLLCKGKPTPAKCLNYEERESKIAENRTENKDKKYDNSTRT